MIAFENKVHLHLLLRATIKALLFVDNHDDNDYKKKESSLIFWLMWFIDYIILNADWLEFYSCCLKQTKINFNWKGFWFSLLSNIESSNSNFIDDWCWIELITVFTFVIIFSLKFKEASFLLTHLHYFLFKIQSELNWIWLSQKMSLNFYCLFFGDDHNWLNFTIVQIDLVAYFKFTKSNGFRSCGCNQL